MKIADHVIEEYDEESGKFILIDIQEGKLFHINASAHEIVQSIKRTGGLDGYYSRMWQCRANADVDVIQQDALHFLDNLKEKGYLIA